MATRTEDALTRLLAVALVLQSIDDGDLVANKVTLSLSLQEVAKHIGDAHGLDFMSMLEAAADHLREVANSVDTAEDLTAATISKAMKK
jgi:hypothetical protein